MNGAFVYDHINQQPLSQALIPRQTVQTVIRLLDRSMMFFSTPMATTSRSVRKKHCAASI